MSDETLVLCFLFWVFVLNPLVGCLIGATKGRTGLGALLGLVLGVIGWLIIAVMGHAKPLCPACHSKMPDWYATKCWRCSTPVTLTPPPKSFWETPLNEAVRNWFRSGLR
jgi:ribosomal protein L37AE/L43A